MTIGVILLGLVFIVLLLFTCGYIATTGLPPGLCAIFGGGSFGGAGASGSFG